LQRCDKTALTNQGQQDFRVRVAAQRYARLAKLSPERLVRVDLSVPHQRQLVTKHWLRAARRGIDNRQASMTQADAWAFGTTWIKRSAPQPSAIWPAMSERVRHRCADRFPFGPR
jgi:hypothetical protein